MLQFIIILFTLKDIGVTILTLSISYLHPREKNLKSRIRLKENFNSPIIHNTNVHEVHTQFLKIGNKY